ncbi:MAG: hypothetical protein B7733_05805 [Myxococcales bacterium FL481]|nr:MAG: hypothetical protein B7733_05805 [Myxococcales bacterium FL481]
MTDTTTRRPRLLPDGVPMVDGGRDPGPATALTPAVIEAIELGLEEGLPMTVISQSLGFRPTRITAWLSKARRQDRDGITDSPYIDLLNVYQAARARGLANLHNTIRRASNKDWKAAAWILERVAGETYGKEALERNAYDQEALEGTDSEQLRQLSDEALAELEDKLHTQTKMLEEASAVVDVEASDG